MKPHEPIHLEQRDRVAFAYRVAGAIAGLPLAFVAVTTSSWDSGWFVALFALVTVGGALAYHLLTSVTRCPACRRHVFTWRVSSCDLKRKTFSCRRCGTSSYSTEGFYWQEDVAG